ncbi:MAG: hypothetical protein GF364_01980 [Candidatus Lokiarchaeota archaeon]|nr:hypothetical protein [Candidatus Lokiarchaeota archaeon]
MAYIDDKDRDKKEKEFLKQLDISVAIFQDIKDELEHVLIISHTDADGYASATIIQRMLNRDGIKSSIDYFNRTSTWDDYLYDIVPRFDRYENFAVFFTDIGSEIREIAEFFDDDPAHIFILDHHELEEIPKDLDLDRIHIVNPTIYGLDGLKEIAGAALAYLFAKRVSLKNVNNAWIALIGITNDTLMNVDDYRSYNQQVLEEAVNEEQVELKDGLFVYAATHEKVKNALAYSLFPFVKEFGGNPKKATVFLNRQNIDENKKVVDLTDEEVNKINDQIETNVKGKYIIFPKKKTILRYAFEHGLIISISHFKNKRAASKLIASPRPPADLKIEYTRYISEVSNNLSMFVKTPKDYKKTAIFVDAGRRIPSIYWSDVASYSSVNNLYNPNKVLFLGGQDGKIIKLSVRCSEHYPPLKNGKGVDEIIYTLKKEFGGIGGGHKLAGGYKLAPNRFKKMKRQIDSILSSK